MVQQQWGTRRSDCRLCQPRDPEKAILFEPLSDAATENRGFEELAPLDWEERPRSIESGSCSIAVRLVAANGCFPDRDGMPVIDERVREGGEARKTTGIQPLVSDAGSSNWFPADALGEVSRAPISPTKNTQYRDQRKYCLANGCTAPREPHRRRWNVAYLLHKLHEENPPLSLWLFTNLP